VLAQLAAALRAPRGLPQSGRPLRMHAAPSACLTAAPGAVQAFGKALVALALARLAAARAAARAGAPPPPPLSAAAAAAARSSLHRRLAAGGFAATADAVHVRAHLRAQAPASRAAPARIACALYLAGARRAWSSVQRPVLVALSQAARHTAGALAGLACMRGAGLTAC